MQTRSSEIKMEVHTGYLTVKVVSNIFKTKSYSDTWCILFSGNSQLSAQIDLYASPADVKKPGKCKKNILLDQAKWLNPSSSSMVGFTFGFSVKDREYWFVAPTEDERWGWVFCLLCVSGDLFDTKILMGSSQLAVIGAITSASEMRVFDVIPETKGFCLQHNIKGHLQLCVESAGLIRIVEKKTLSEVVEWPLSMLRNYGYSKSYVFFNAGSQSKTGIGLFQFWTTEGGRIIQAITIEAKRMEQSKQQTFTEPPYANQPVIDQSGGSQFINGKEAESKELHKKKPLPPRKPKPSSLSSETEQDHSDLVTSNTSSHISPKPNKKALCDSFMNKLDNTLSIPPVRNFTQDKKLIEPSVSSSSGTSKLDKKSMRELDKEKKKKEKQDKIEQKEREKQARKEREKQAKKSKQKSNLKKTKCQESEEVSVAVDESIEHGPDMYSVIDSGYATANNIVIKPLTAVKPFFENDVMVYSEPWRNKPIFTSLQTRSNAETYEDSTEDMYAQSDKIRTNKTLLNEPTVPFKTFNLEEANNNVYDHCNQFQALGTEPTENIYGIGSASAPFNPTENVYETSENVYELSDVQE